MKGSFRGGIRPDPRKRITRLKPLETLEPPALLTVPLALRADVECSAEASPGKQVCVGTRIGHGEVPVHSPVSGRVIAVGPKPLPAGGSVLSIVIENDFRDTPDPFIKPRGGIETLSPEEIIELSYTAGLVLTGSGEPVHARLRALGDTPCDTLIIDCTENEPYVTARRRVLLDRTDEFLSGVRIYMKALSPKKTVLALSADLYDAAERIMKRLSKADPIELRLLRPKHPQGDERRLIRAVTGSRLVRGARSESIGCLVLDPESAAELYRAATTGAPLLTRSVTVAGDAVANPKNLLVRIGTPLSALIDAAGDLRLDPKRLLLGGVLTGAAIDGADYPVTLNTTALLAFSEAESPVESETACIRCGKCAAACPEALAPLYISLYLSRGSDAELMNTGVLSCIECGCCAYVCPAKLPLTEHARRAKTRLRENIAKREKRLVPPAARGGEPQPDPEPSTPTETEVTA